MVSDIPILEYEGTMLRFVSMLLVLLLVGSAGKAQSVLSLDGSHRMRYMTWDEGLWGVGGSPVSAVLNRTRVGLTLRPADGVEFRAGLLNEFTNWIEYPTERPFNFDEIIFEHLYARWRDTLGLLFEPGLPFEVTVGRQDMRLGDGFLIMDASPLDGSRSLYVNAARFDVEPFPRQRLTLFYLHAPMTDELLPIINDLDRRLSEYERDMRGIYFAGASGPVEYEANVMHARGGYETFWETNRETDMNTSVLTYGALVRTEIAKGLRFIGELAVQSARIGEWTWSHELERQYAYRFEAAWSPAVLETMQPRLRAGVFHYPGEWDPLLGRWPMWNESIAFSRGILLAPAFWKNFRGAFLEASFKPLPALLLKAGMQSLDHAETSIDGSGSIGRLLTLHVFWKPDFPLSGHLMLEHMAYDNSFLAVHGKRMPNSYLWGRVDIVYVMPGFSLL